MKLRNKKTGEIVEATDFNIISDYNSLAELNEEWEDYEEKGWYITENGEVRENRSLGIVEEESEYRKIGNCFRTKEEAEKAVEKLKAWKRLKDAGFRFQFWSSSYSGDNISFFIDWINADSKRKLKKH